MQAIFTRKPDVPTAEFGTELAVMDLQSGAYITFNRTAAEVWKLLETPQSLDSLTSALAARYSVDHDRCRDELEALLAELVGMNIVQRRA